MQKNSCPPGQVIGTSYLLAGVALRPAAMGSVRDAMPVFFDLLEKEPEGCVRAVLGHWLFGHIHRYPNGNGRMGRFLMNVMLASGGYPWTVIRLRERKSYLAALDSANIGTKIEPFAALV